MTDEHAPPPTPPFMTQITDRLTHLTRLVAEHQAYVSALHEYLRADSTYNTARFETVHDAERARLNLPEYPAPALDALLQGLLRDFEGPPQ